MLEQYGSLNAFNAADDIREAMRIKGMNHEGATFDGVILGSGLGDFADKYLKNGISLSFNEIYAMRGMEKIRDGQDVPGHARRIIIAHLDGAPENAYTIAQAGREHPYEGPLDARRATFWIRVMQMLGARSLIGSNASGILTPDTLKPPAMMLIEGHRDYGNDNPLVGLNDDKLGPRFPHMADLYTAQLRARIKKVAEANGIPLSSGMYMRTPGPHYEPHAHVYELRAALKQIWAEAQLQPGEEDFKGPVTGVVGMSSTYEVRVAQHASQSNKHPAFQDGKAFMSVATNYSGSLGAEGIVIPSNHEEVQENAARVQKQFGLLIKEVLLSLQNERKAN